jgi:hypothetical protein
VAKEFEVLGSVQAAVTDANPAASLQPDALPNMNTDFRRDDRDDYAGCWRALLPVGAVGPATPYLLFGLGFSLDGRDGWGPEGLACLFLAGFRGLSPLPVCGDFF